MARKKLIEYNNEENKQLTVVCSNCKRENELRNYYCWYCGMQIKPFNMYKKFGERNTPYYNLECVKDDSNDIVKDSYAPYRSKEKVDDKYKKKNRK